MRIVKIWREKHAFLYYIAFSLLCNISVIFFFSDSGTVFRWIGSCKNTLKNSGGGYEGVIATYIASPLQVY